MEESPKEDTMSPSRRRSERVVLDLQMYDRLAAEIGLTTQGEQAAYHGVPRQRWSAIRNGHKGPSAALALRVADQLGVAVRVLWHREAVTR